MSKANHAATRTQRATAEGTEGALLCAGVRFPRQAWKTKTERRARKRATALPEAPALLACAGMGRPGVGQYGPAWDIFF